MNRALRRRHGMAMVEMIIMAPLLLMLVFAISEFGIMFGRWQSLTNAAREGARAAVVFRTPCTPASVETEVKNRVIAYASSLGMTVSTGDVSVTGQCGGPTTNSAVTVNHAYDFNVLPGFVSSLSPTINLVGSSTMRNEG